MESQQVGDAPQNVQVHPNNEFLQYMQINADFYEWAIETIRH